MDDDCDALIDGADPSVDHPSACQLVGDISLSNTGAKLTGEASSDYAGVSVANAGDVNSDGYGDLLVGAYGEDIDGLGAAYVVLGPVTGDASLSTADAKLSGENAGDYAGWCVSTAGDVDNDGYDDVLVGAYGEDSGGSNAGAAYLVLGPISGTMTMASADGKFTGEFGGDQAGVSVSDAGDVDNDGQGDFLVGAPGEDTGGSYAGAAYLFYGPVKGNKSLSRADAKLTGASAGDYAGWSVSSAGDVDGDGLDDILVGARYESTGGANAGAVYLVHGPLAGDLDLASADAIRTGEASDDLAGWSISGAGDVDNDGHADVVIGAPGEDSAGTSAGAAYLVHGPFNGTSSLADSDAKFTGESSEDDAGYSVSTAGDSDLDGRSDILVGARYEDSVAADAGAAYLLYGPLSGSRSLKAAAAKLSGESADDNAGWSVSTAEDVNGDGHSDLLMGAYGEDSGGAKAGAVYLVFGSVY